MSVSALMFHAACGHQRCISVDRTIFTVYWPGPEQEKNGFYGFSRSDDPKKERTPKNKENTYVSVVSPFKYIFCERRQEIKESDILSSRVVWSLALA